MMGDVFFDCRVSSATLRKARGEGCSSEVRKKRSTILSQEALVGVKWKWKRGLRFCHALFLMFVRGVVVTDDVDFFVGRCAPFDQVKEAQPFLMPVLIHACANDAAVGYVHCCKQGGRALRL